jgi:predicted Zn-dependent protease with MMP-like domain
MGRNAGKEGEGNADREPEGLPNPGGFSKGKRFFERLVVEAVQTLPEDLRTRLENVAFLVEDESPPFEDGPDEIDDELLGLYHGVSQKDRGFWYGNTLPDRIIIYRKPLERISRDAEELRENVRQTVVHEVGHYFGFDEEELEALEDGDPEEP